MIVGVGGQGTLLTSRILGGITVAAGYDVKLSEVHGMAQRGGSVVTFVRYGEKVAEPIVEEGQADVLIAFEMLEALRYAHFLKKDGAIVVNEHRIDPITVVTGAATYPENIIENLEKEYKVYKVNAMEEALGGAAFDGLTVAHMILRHHQVALSIQVIGKVIVTLHKFRDAVDDLQNALDFSLGRPAAVMDLSLSAGVIPVVGSHCYPSKIS